MGSLLVDRFGYSRKLFACLTNPFETIYGTLRIGLGIDYLQDPSLPCQRKNLEPLRSKGISFPKLAEKNEENNWMKTALFFFYIITHTPTLNYLLWEISY